jgi:2-dehydro-3-deoxygluconokinase
MLLAPLRRWFAGAALSALPLTAATAVEYTTVDLEGKKAVVCRVKLTEEKLELFLRDDTGHPLKSFAGVNQFLAPLMQYVDLCVTSAEEARYVFGIDWPDDAIPNAAESETSHPDRDECAAARLVERFGFKTVALTKRSATAAETTEWSAMLHSAGESVHSRRHQITIVDRLGAGDSFSGALIYALRRGDSLQAAIDFAIAASALKHTIQGDFNRVSLEEVEALAAGATGGRVRR